jgi:hypothetical protein
MAIGMAIAGGAVRTGDDRLETSRARLAGGEAPTVSAFVQHPIGIALHGEADRARDATDLVAPDGTSTCRVL